MQLLKELPHNSTLEEIQYHLYVRQKIQRGIKDSEEGKTYTQEEMEKRMEKWRAKRKIEGAGPPEERRAAVQIFTFYMFRDKTRLLQQSPAS